MARIVTLQSNETFRRSLTIDEGRVYDAIQAHKALTGRELSKRLELPAGLIKTLYDRAFDKFVKYATRTEM